MRRPKFDSPMCHHLPNVKSRIKSSIQNSRLTVKLLLAKCKSIHQNTTRPASSIAGKDKRIILVDLDFHGTSSRTVTLMNMVSSILPVKMLGLIHGTMPFPVPSAQTTMSPGYRRSASLWLSSITSQIMPQRTTFLLSRCSLKLHC